MTLTGHNQMLALYSNHKHAPYFIVFQPFVNINLRCKKVILHTWPNELEIVKEV